MEPDIIQAIRAHAAQEYPRESCGLLVQVQGLVSYVPCHNLAAGNEHFILDPQDHADTEARGTVIAIVHSHPDACPEPSEADRSQIEAWGIPWFIVSWPSEEIRESRPGGYHPPLVGRVFSHGTLDCFSLIRDYYLETLGIELPDFTREDEWWDKGQNLYLDGYSKAGFVPVSDGPKPHDVILMQLKAPVPNHAGIYLGNDVIFHHLPNRLSRRDGYSGLWSKITTLIVRHGSLCKQQSPSGGT